MELWKSDGTQAGTVMVEDISAAGSYPNYLTNVTAESAVHTPGRAMRLDMVYDRSALNKEE